MNRGGSLYTAVSSTFEDLSGHGNHRERPEYADDEIVVEDQPGAEDAPPTTQSPDYILDTESYFQRQIGVDKLDIEEDEDDDIDINANEEDEDDEMDIEVDEVAKESTQLLLPCCQTACYIFPTSITTISMVFITTLTVLTAPPPSPIRSLGYRAATIRIRAEAAATSHSLPLPPPFILSPTRPDAPPPMPTSAPTSLPPFMREDQTSTQRDMLDMDQIHGYEIVETSTGGLNSRNTELGCTRLDEYAIRKKIIESKTTELNTDTSKSITSETVDDEDDVSEKEGIGFKKIKACFVCKSTDYFIKDCDFYAKKSPEPKLKTLVNTGQRVVKLVWDNAKRTGLVNLVRPNRKRAVHTVSTAMPVSTARLFAPKIAQTGSAIRPIYPRMDNVRPRALYSPIKRSYYTKPAFRPKNLKQDVKTFRVKNMTTTETRAVVNTGKDKMDNALKKSRWVWRPKGNYMDHESKEKGSFILKKFEDRFTGLGSGDKGGNADELVSTARPEVSTARPDIDVARQEDSAVEPRTPPTTTSIFDDEDITMVQTLIKMKEEKANEKGVSIKYVDDSSRPERSILTLKPLPTIDPKDKGKGVLKESPVKKVKRSDLDAAQIAKDAEIARLGQASVDYIASLYEEVQAKMDASEELAVRLQMEEREMYTIEERSKLLVEFFKRRKKLLAEERAVAALYIKEQERDADFVPIGSERDVKMIDKMNKKAAGVDEEEVPESTKVEVKKEGHEENIRKRLSRRLKMKATNKSKRQKTDSDLEEEEQLRAYLKIVPDKEEEIDYEVLSMRVFRANGSSRYIKTFTEMVSIFDRLDFIELHSLVMQRFSTTTPKGIDLVLWGDLRIMFEETANDDI
ncbi:hypothetical protein Tco_0823894 [Tanacetum coccineum]|uniref:Reverse transcriptase domain-containing protein n=1 Tax=Tanacetum coccineum TaxID=301880 RepID=A0ABQ5AJ72_9ASTR